MTKFIASAFRVPTFFWIISIIIVAGSCSKDQSTMQNEFDPAVEKTLQNEPYGSGSREVADIYLPANRNGETRVIIMMHGGGWSDGNKMDLNDVVNLIRVQWPEVAIVNMNYRLADNTPANYHPAQMNDINALLDYLDTRRSLWQIGSKYAIAGVSAGGHLGLLYSYKFNSNSRVKAVVSVVGPTDFSDPFYTGNILFQVIATNLLGKTWLQDADLHRSVSPALQVTTSSPPTLMAYGALDPIVPLSNAASLRANLQSKGITHTYIEYPNEGHEFSTAAINNLVPQVVQFLKARM